ncbi:MAG: transposase, partial [Deltaproteobacteria bacterium]|nr:transposase [Deltaproteobacteria bacterium]
MDRALYLPRSWTEQTKRCQAAGIPDTVGFATKPRLARQMLQRALDAGSKGPRRYDWALHRLYLDDTGWGHRLSAMTMAPGVRVLSVAKNNHGVITVAYTDKFFAVYQRGT